MITLVIYGRNDNYGYNLHKRAALSLNCMAEVLTAPSDEIIFVDYNTPDDYPTFPEAIVDTLTEKAKDKLRILRVRPSLHDRFRRKTHLKALEPISRNIGVRRMNPNNRWILSTNTDMIFVPRKGASLSDIAANLAPGFYHLPRFEIPETLWETFDRLDAVNTIKSVEHWGRTAHLNEIVLGPAFIKYDAPGDFQLIQRSDFFRINGFDEDMLLGWHVDSNIARRLHLIYGEVGDLVDQVFGYHCDHTRQVTPAHSHNSVANDLGRFVYDVTQPELDNPEWGCAKDDIEEIHLSRMRNVKYLDGLKAVIDREQEALTTVSYNAEYYDASPFSPRHVLPYLADLFVNAPPKMKVAWFGANREMFRLFRDMWSSLEIGGPIIVTNEIADILGLTPRENVNIASFAAAMSDADNLVFDFSRPVGTPARQDELRNAVTNVFISAVVAEQERLLRGKSPRRFAALDAIHNRFDPLVNTYMGAARTPFNTRIRHGFVFPQSPIDWMSSVHVGAAGRREKDGAISVSAGTRGNVLSGPHQQSLLPGNYVLRVGIKKEPTPAGRLTLRWPGFRIGRVKVSAGERVLVRHRLKPEDLGGELALPFERQLSDANGQLLDEAFQVTVWSSGAASFSVDRLVLERVGLSTTAP